MPCESCTYMYSSSQCDTLSWWLILCYCNLYYLLWLFLVSMYQLVPAVTELVISELMYLQWSDPKEPIYLYINSTGTTRADGETVMGFQLVIVWNTRCTVQTWTCSLCSSYIYKITYSAACLPLSFLAVSTHAFLVVDIR